MNVLRAGCVAMLAGGATLFQAGCLSGYARNQETPDAPQVMARTSEGLVIKGVPCFDRLEFQTAVGRIASTPEALSRITFMGDETARMAVVEFRNGDRLSGTPADRQVSIRSPYGLQEVPFRDLESLVFELAGPGGDAADGLVRYYAFDTDPFREPSRIVPDRVLVFPNDKPLQSAQGRVGGALSCDGQSSFLVTGGQALSSTSRITMAAWIRPDRAQYSPVLQFSTTCEQYGPHLWTTEDGALYVNLWGRPGNDRIVRSHAGLVQPGAWTHIAATYDGERCVIYVNGSVVTERTVGPLVLECQHPFLVGAFLGTDRRVVFSGLIDEARVYNRALTGEEVRGLCDFRGKPVAAKGVRRER